MLHHLEEPQISLQGFSLFLPTSPLLTKAGFRVDVRFIISNCCTCTVAWDAAFLSERTSSTVGKAKRVYRVHQYSSVTNEECIALATK